MNTQKEHTAKDCQSCEVIYINGAKCHEHGCPELKIEAWRNGESVDFDSHVPTMLRAANGYMKTSKSARVPLEEANRAYKFVLHVRTAGWQRNGEQFKVGTYDLDRVNEQGVIAGCHRISWEEIFRFADAMGWQQIGEENLAV